MRTAFVNALISSAAHDEDIVLLTGDLGFGFFEKFENLYPDRFFNLGIAEQAMAGIAAGLAKESKKVIYYSIGNFPTIRCLEQIRNDICYHNLNVTIVSSGVGFSYGQLGMSHHATEDLAIMRALPNLKIYSPSTTEESFAITKLSIDDPSPVYLRLDKASAHEPLSPFELGKLRQFRSGNDFTVVCTSSIVNEVLIAAESLMNEENIDLEIYTCHSIKPFDYKTLFTSIQRTRKLLVVEEGNVMGGLSSVISEYCMLNSIKLDVYSVMGLPDLYSAVVGDQFYLRKIYQLDASSIYGRIVNLQKEL